MDGWMDRRIDEWTNGQMNGRMVKLTDIWTEYMDRWTDMQTTDRQTDRQIDRQLDGQICGSFATTCVCYIMYFMQLLWVLEHLQAVTCQSPETLNERHFQTEYGELIDIAIQKLQNPGNYKSPHTLWDPFKQVHCIICT